jgi:hypothetical protein
VEGNIIWHGMTKQVRVESKLQFVLTSTRSRQARIGGFY